MSPRQESITTPDSQTDDQYHENGRIRTRRLQSICELNATFQQNRMTLTSLTVPPTVARPRGQEAASTSDHKAPPCTLAILASWSTVTLLRYLDKSMTNPPSLDEAPDGLWPPPESRHTSFLYCSRSRLTLDSNFELDLPSEFYSGRDIFCILDKCHQPSRPLRQH